MNSIIEQLIRLLLTAVGTGLGLFLCYLAWRHFTRPKLEFERTTEKFPGGEGGDYYYRVRVRNKGRDAAENCKPILEMEGEGQLDYVSGRPYRWIKVGGPLCWAELGNPARLTINKDESVTFDLCLKKEK